MDAIIIGYPRVFKFVMLFAQYHGCKLQIVQNEKLIRYGVTHFVASNGYIIVVKSRGSSQ